MILLLADNFYSVPVVSETFVECETQQHVQDPLWLITRCHVTFNVK